MKIRPWAFALVSLFLASPAASQEECLRVQSDTGTVHACASGAGPVSVVLAAGAGQTSRTWEALQQRLSQTTRVVTFDRPGLGESPPGQSPRTPTRIARELRSVIEALELTGPLVLVGHSMGGLHVLRYATLYPENVIGVVLIDTPPPDFEEKRLTLLTPEEREERQRILRLGVTGVPDAVGLERKGAKIPSEWDFSAFPRSLPLSVVVADSQNFGDLGSLDAHRELWVEASRQWLDLSSAGQFNVAGGSGHMVHHDRPEIVLRVIHEMVRTGAGPNAAASGTPATRLPPAR